VWWNRAGRSVVRPGDSDRTAGSAHYLREIIMDENDETTDTEFESGFGSGEYGGYDLSGEVDPITGFVDTNETVIEPGFGEGEWGGYDLTGETDPITGYVDSNYGSEAADVPAVDTTDSFDDYIRS
jgi:hypothetical protein